MKNILFKGTLLTLILSVPLIAKSENSAKSMLLGVPGREISYDPTITCTSLTNKDWETTINFNLMPGNSPLTVEKIEWVKRDTVLTSIEPLARVFENKSKSGDNIYWDVKVKFPYYTYFERDDKLFLYTDKGILKTPTSLEGIYNEKIRELKDTNEKFTAESIQKQDELLEKISKEQRNKSLFRLLLIIAAGILVLSWITIFIILKKIKIKNKEVAALLENTRKYNEESRRSTKAMEELFLEKYYAVNLLCDSYFENDNSDIMKRRLYNEINKYLDSFKDQKRIEKLQYEVNLLYNNAINEIKDKSNDIATSDLNILIFILNGFSPKAVCIFTNINIKQFYYRRSKIKELIEKMDISDKNRILSKL